MAVSLSATGVRQLRGSSGLTPRDWRPVNGELMGKKLNFSQRVQSKNNVKSIVAVILGGGAGTRLFPLTKRRAKPAVPIGGAYRLIDVPMSNCINSGINKVYILTQFNSASLNRHLARAYNFGNDAVRQFHWLFEVPTTSYLCNTKINFFKPSQTNKKCAKKRKEESILSNRKRKSNEPTRKQDPGGWEVGRPVLYLKDRAAVSVEIPACAKDARSKDIDDVLILSGDHLYRMDYMDFLQKRFFILFKLEPIFTFGNLCLLQSSSICIHDSRASDFGLMKIDGKGRVLSFSEKPKGNDLKAMAVDTTILGLSKEEAEKKPYIASMGVYIFKKEILLNLLRWRFPTANDFGSEIIPASASEYYIKAFLFNDYWEDIGTIRSFFEANLALTEHPSRFSFYDATKPMYTSRRNLPPSNVDNCKIVDSIISHGSFLTDSFIEHSVVGIRSRINSNVHLKDTVMLGADYYETDAEITSLLAEGRVPIGIGENTKITGCIIDKNARIGKNVVIANSEGIQEADRSSEGFYIRSGVTILLKNSTIKDGLVI
ncbi:ADP-glucose pyrophosphorylase, conserved site-containing protein [Cynara cardunculus var. scolymus]|uniref:glucose-1-phosphate adenylyltransferase n=1 Tax=Cynara cardunculus var. scolymus TaxID=59895 RepID=A0A103Y2X1_CYNCS|nr:ADP-glucose pyrophosphorylase, conserved site-containing protein [Cynara cardunculus var. scolymus]